MKITITVFQKIRSNGLLIFHIESGNRVYENYINDFFINIIVGKTPKMKYPHNCGHRLSGRKLFTSNIMLRSKKSGAVMMPKGIPLVQDI